jgi:hypothetical protein
MATVVITGRDISLSFTGGTDISVTLTAATGAQFVFPIMPEFPTAGGAGTDAQTVDFTFKVSKGAVVETFS